MGRDDMSVVDSQLRVYGVKNLRVADGSIMPRITTGNTHAPCVGHRRTHGGDPPGLSASFTKGNDMSQLTQLAFFRARAGQTRALGAALSDRVEPTRREAECINYDLHQSAEDIEVWFVHENWRSPVDWAHT
jgi:hypothetical protein